MPIKVEIERVDEIVTKTVQKGGRISGLGDWEGKKVKIILMEENFHDECSEPSGKKRR